MHARGGSTHFVCLLIAQSYQGVDSGSNNGYPKCDSDFNYS